MYNVGRNNPRIRAALIEALELDTPGMLAMGVTALPGLLAEALLAAHAAAARARASSRAPAPRRSKRRSSSVAQRRSARASLSDRPRLPRADARLALRERQRRVHSAFPAAAAGFRRACRSATSTRSRRELRREDVAVFLVEPIQGKGVHLPPAGYLEARRSSAAVTARSSASTKCRPGFGRTGKLFAFEHWGLEPDLVPVAKSLSGGYVPVGALLMSRAVHEAVFDSMENAVSPRLDVRAERACDGGGPRDAARAGRAAPRRALARTLGERLLERTQPLVDEFEVVRDVRGLGLMWAIEFGEPEHAAAYVADARAHAARALRAARRRAALLRPPHPESGRGARHGRRASACRR